MKVTEIIRGLLDLIDGEEIHQEPQAPDYEEEIIVPVQEPVVEPEIMNRPNEIYTSLEIIDTMGNDLNAIKKPEDVKSATFPMFFGMTNG